MNLQERVIAPFAHIHQISFRIVSHKFLQKCYIFLFVTQKFLAEMLPLYDP